MAIDAKKWLQDAAAEAGLSTEQVEALVKNDKFLGKVSEGVMLRSDYSRSQDQLKADKEAAEAGMRTWYENNQKVVDQYAASLAAYEQRYGPVNGGNGGTGNGGLQFDASKFVSATDFQAALKKAADEARTQAINTNVVITKEAIRAANDYSRRFGKDLDLDALEKFALDKQLPLRQAYSEFIAGEAAEKAKADEEKRINDAVSQRLAAELSKRNLPTESAQTESSVFAERLKAPADQAAPSERDQMAAFTEEWNKAGSHV